MKRINNLTYLNSIEIYNKMKEEYSDKINFTQDEINNFLIEGKIKSRKIDNKLFASLCDTYFFFNSNINKDVYSKSEYGGGIGVDLVDVKLDGKILDIGGGGEGIIGQLKGDRVISIDPSKRELEEAPEGGLKIEMDGTDLKFLDNSFDTVTSFFTFMYIQNTNHKKVFEEIYRVLKCNGEFILWDINIPRIFDNKKELYLVYLEVTIPQKTIYTGYGTKWKTKEQNMKYFSDLGKSIGFKEVEFDNLYSQGYSIRFIKN